MSTLEIPNRIEAKINGRKVGYPVKDFINIIIDRYAVCGNETNEGDIKRQIWNLLNQREIDELGTFISDFLWVE